MASSDLEKEALSTNELPPGQGDDETEAIKEDKSWYTKPSLGEDSLGFLTNFFVTICGQLELNTADNSQFEK